jgi:hypothetical protein
MGLSAGARNSRYALVVAAYVLAGALRGELGGASFSAVATLM